MEKTVAAARKSKSLEEPQLQCYQESDNLSRNYGAHRGAPSLLTASVHKQYFLSDYRSLTEYDKKKNDVVKNFVAAQRRLEDQGFLKPLGR